MGASYKMIMIFFFQQLSGGIIVILKIILKVYNGLLESGGSQTDPLGSPSPLTAELTPPAPGPTIPYTWFCSSLPVHVLPCV